MGSAVHAPLDMAPVGKESFQCLLKRGARDPMLTRDDTSCRRFTIANRKQDQPFVPVEPIPDGLMRVPRFVERELERCGCRISSVALLQQVVEVVGKQNRALGVPRRIDKQAVDFISGVQPVGSEQSFDVMRCLGYREGRKLERASLSVKGSLLVGEQCMHQGRLASGEDISRGLAVVLNDGTHQAVHRLVGDQNLLKLVEADDRQFSVGLVQRTGDVQQLEQSRARLVRRRSRWSRRDADADPRNRGANLEASRPPPNTAPWVCRQLGESTGDPGRDVADGGDLGEVDSHGTVTGIAHASDVGIQEAALAKAARSRKPNCDSVGGRALQVVELSSPVDQVRRRDWALVIERIHRTLVYGNSVQIQTEAGESCG